MLVIDHLWLDLVHLVVDVPHSADRDYHCHAEHNILDDRVECARLAVLPLLEHDTV